MKLKISAFEVETILDERAFSRWRRFAEDYFADGHKYDQETLSMDMFGDAATPPSALARFAFIEIARLSPINIVIQYMIEEGWLCKEERDGKILYYKNTQQK